MAFLNPILLFGMLGVSVPIIIHLLNRRRVERVWWGAMRFIQVSIEKNQRKLRVEDLLLLLIRCAVVLLLALALARPALRAMAAGVFGEARVTAVLAIDTSASMGATDGVRSRIELARESAKSLIESLPSGSQVAVWAVGDAVHPLIPEPTADLNLVRRTIDEIQLTDCATNLLPAVKQGVALLKRQGAARRELYLITDGQRGGLRELDELCRTLDEAASEVHATAILVGTADTQNLGVSELRQSSGIAAVGRPLRFAATITNYGHEDAHDIRVLLRVDGKTSPPVDEAAIDRLAAGESRAVSLFARLPSAGFHAVRAEITSDRLPADNERTIIVRAADQFRVLLIDGNLGSEPRAAQAFYLRMALGSDPAGGQTGSAIRTDTISAPEMASARLDDYDAVILAGVADISPVTGDALAQYLLRGGGVLFFPGPDTRPELINRELVQRRPILPASLGTARGEPDAKKALLTFSMRDVEHPIAAVWKDAAAGDLSAASFFRVFPLTLTDAPKPAAGAPAPPEGLPRIILKYSDGSPAIVERTYGLGRVIEFSSTANTQWNDMPVRPGVFVPLLNRTLGAVVASQDEQLNFRVGSSLAYRPPSDWLGREVQIYPPEASGPSSEAHNPPESRRVELISGEPRLTFADTDLAGVYTAKAGEAELKFAAVRDPAESDLTPLSAPEHDQLARAATVVSYESSASLHALTTARSGTELWFPLAILVTLLALTESALAWWFSHPK